VKKQHPAILYKNDKAGTLSEAIIHPEIESGGTQRSGFVAGNMKITKVDADRISGEIADNPKSSEWLSEKHFAYSVKAAFDAPLPKVEPGPTVLNATMGTALPKGGGDPGKSFLQLLSAIKTKNLATIRKLDAGNTKASDDEINQVVAMFSDIVAGTCSITKGFEKDNSATVHTECKTGKERNYAIAILSKQNGIWVVQNQRWGDIPQ
jgi:hypothetical protein